MILPNSAFLIADQAVYYRLHHNFRDSSHLAVVLLHIYMRNYCLASKHCWFLVTFLQAVIFSFPFLVVCNWLWPCFAVMFYLFKYNPLNFHEIFSSCHFKLVCKSLSAVKYRCQFCHNIIILAFHIYLILHLVERNLCIILIYSGCWFYPSLAIYIYLSRLLDNMYMDINIQTK